jgi:transcriptional regulator with XRE-family HTH domain
VLFGAINASVKPELHYKTIIKEELAKRCERNSRYSLRAFAKALGLEAGVLSLILSGKSTPSYKTAQIILSNLDLTPEHASNFLSSLAEAHKLRGMKRVNPNLKKIAGKSIIPDLSVDLFRIIGDWYHYAILMLTCTEGFKSDCQWIATQRTPGFNRVLALRLPV